MALVIFLRLHSGLGCFHPIFPPCFSLEASNTLIKGLSHTFPPSSPFSFMHHPMGEGISQGPESHS